MQWKKKKKKNKKKNESNERNGFILIEIPNFIALIAIDLIKKCNFNRTTRHSRINGIRQKYNNNNNNNNTIYNVLLAVHIYSSYR